MIYIHGYYGFKNCGDEAFKVFFSHFFKERKIVFTSPKSPPPKIPAAGDVVVLGGGNVVDKYFLKDLESWKGRVIPFGVGLNSYEGLDILSKFNVPICYVRNSSELEAFKSKIPNSQVVPDLIFGLTPNDILKSDVGGFYSVSDYKKNQNLKAGLEKNLVIILSDRIISFLKNHRDFVGGMKDLNGLLDFIAVLKEMAKYYNIIFLAFSEDFYHPDHALNEIIGGTLSGFVDRITYVKASEQPAKAFDVIRDSDLILSMKFHSAVFALLANKKILNISDAPKCLSLMKDFKIQDWSMPLSAVGAPENMFDAIKKIESSVSDFTEDLSVLRIKVTDAVNNLLLCCDNLSKY